MRTWMVVLGGLAAGCADKASLGQYGDSSSSGGMGASTGPSSTLGTSSSEGSSTGTEVGPSTTTDDGGDSSSSSETLDFISMPDGGSKGCSATSWCDIWAQDCEDDALKCVPWSGDGDDDIAGCVISKCAVLDPAPVAPGGLCTVVDHAWSGDDDCAAGSFCWDVDPQTLQGTCVALCGGNQADPSCDDGLECFVAFNAWLSACVPPCDPLGAPCAAGSTCVVEDGEPAVCVPTSFGIASTAGAECIDDIGCGEGLACVDGSGVPDCAGQRCCATLCDPAASDCVEPQICTPLALTPDVGACTSGA